MIKIKFSSSFVAVSSRSMEKPCDSNKQFTQAIRFLINFCYLRFVNTLFHSYSPLMSKVPDKKKITIDTLSCVSHNPQQTFLEEYP